MNTLLKIDRLKTAIDFTIKTMAAMVVVFGSSAQAQWALPNGPVPVSGWCAIQARMRITSGALIVGGAHGRGFGRIVCEYANGTEETLPILIETSAIGVGFQLPQTIDAKMFSSGFGVTNAGAIGLLGTYGITRLSAGVGYWNGEIGLNATVNETGFSIPMTFQVDKGFQVIAGALNFGELTLRFDPRNTQAILSREMPVVRPRRVPPPDVSAPTPPAPVAVRAHAPAPAPAHDAATVTVDPF